MNKMLAQFLEEIAANAWPPLHVQYVDGWRFRHSEGVHSRANSVWPNGDEGQLSLEEKIQLAEAFYQRHGLPARYQISPASQPQMLDTVLAERGYTLYEPVQVQTAVLATTLTHTKPAYSATIQTALPASWLAFDNHIAQRTLHQAKIRRHIMSHIAPQTTFATIHKEDQIVGIGLGVYERGWLGVFNMLTAPAARRRGIGTAVLHALAQWGQQQGATRIYLQVVAINNAAQALYSRAGFTFQYTYHYRQQPQ